VIEKGKLTPRVLEMFQQTECEAVQARIKELGISSWIPPLLPTSRGGPLGYSRPSWE